jgi:hypothetical protein
LARVIWNKSGNPTSHVSDQLGIERWRLREAIHKIKSSANIRPDEQVTIYDDGTVTDANGEPIGNIHDEI